MHSWTLGALWDLSLAPLWSLNPRSAPLTHSINVTKVRAVARARWHRWIFGFCASSDLALHTWTGPTGNGLRSDGDATLLLAGVMHALLSIFRPQEGHDTLFPDAFGPRRSNVMLFISTTLLPSNPKT